MIQTEIKDPLAEEILFGRLKNGGHVRILRPEEAADKAAVKTDNLAFVFDGE